MTREFLRIPRVQRLEYLTAFLNSFSDRAFQEDQATKAIQQQISYFEVEKAKALGRKRPRITKGTSTLPECIKMASHLGLIDRYKRLAADAAVVLDDKLSRAFLIERMWQVYPRFRQFMLLVRDSEELTLPYYARGQEFEREVSSLQDFELDGLTVQTIRDLATQLELVNWHLTADRCQVIYPVSCVATFAEVVTLAGLAVKQETYAQRCLHRLALDLDLLKVQEDRYELSTQICAKAEGYLILQTACDRVFVHDHQVLMSDFEQVLWKEYLDLSGMRSQFPVLYPDLRNRVCVALEISDHLFDHHLLSLIQEPQRLNIYPSGGVLNYAANLAHLSKFLPPKTAQGNFIVYLKIDRKGVT